MPRGVPDLGGVKVEIRKQRRGFSRLSEYPCMSAFSIAPAARTFTRVPSLGFNNLRVLSQHPLIVRGTLNKFLEQRRRKLNVLPSGATNHHRPGRPAIIAQILVCRDAEVKFVAVHGINVLATSKNRSGREGKSHRFSKCCDANSIHQWIVRKCERTKNETFASNRGVNLVFDAGLRWPIPNDCSWQQSTVHPSRISLEACS